MLKNILAAFIGARVEKNANKPVLGAVLGVAALAVARRSLPLALGIAGGMVVMEQMAKRRTAQTL